jgi:hypothetical protein
LAPSTADIPNRNPTAPEGSKLMSTGWKTRLRRLAFAAPLAAALVVTTAGSVQAQVPKPDKASPSIPAEIQVPAGNTLALVFGAQGVQVYTCTDGAWKFTEPAAQLVGYGAKAGFPKFATAIHFRGPSWESTDDGSVVTAASVASSPVTGSIPQLLLKAATNQGSGVFGKVTYVQRLATTGGAAPAGSCTSGAVQGVKYGAEYRFYIAS